MKVIILAAGYATRLHPLTLDRPKALLPVAGKPMVDYVLDNLAPIGGIERVFLVTNARFASQFQTWADDYQARKATLDLAIINDGSTDDATKLGAIGDLHLVLTREKIEDDVIVVAGDNLFSESLEGFGQFCAGRQAPVLGVYDIGDLTQMHRYGAIRMNDEGRITAFEEKSRQPTSTLASTALYFYPRTALPLIHQYVAEGNNHDQPGRLVQWLYARVPFYAWEVPGRWFDIGSPEMLEEANRIFGAAAAV